MQPVKREASDDLPVVLKKKAKELHGHVLDLVTPPSSPAPSPVKVKAEPSSVFSHALSSTTGMGILEISSPSPTKSTSSKKPEDEPDALERDLETLVEERFDEMEGGEEMDCMD